MRQLLTILMAVIAMLSATAQTRSLATLLHDGKLTFYDKVTSLEDAISAAVDGDTIYLSEGKFGASSDSITILNKKISIVGAGYGSDIKPQINFQFKDYQGEDNELKAPLFDGVKLGNLIINDRANCDTILGINLKKCRITNLNFSDLTNDVNIDRCWIDNYYALSIKNINIRNSKIKNFKGCSEVIEHCHLGTITHDGFYTLNSIIGEHKAQGYQMSCTYENCIFSPYSGNSDANHNIKTVNCWSYSPYVKFNAYMETDILADDGIPVHMIGTDGTDLGVYGGEQPFSENPTVPTVDSSKSSVEYDKESNQLNVTITVAPN